MASFCHPKYVLEGGNRIVRTDKSSEVSMIEQGEIMTEIARYVEAEIVGRHGFVSIPIPNDETTPNTSILASPNWNEAPKLLLIVHNASGSQMGIFSRSLCLEQGLNNGSMLPYVERALASGYGVIILRPNTNSVFEELEGGKLKKVVIVGSESPEIHTLCVWENIIPLANATHISLLAYGNGASLCKDLFLREMVQNKSGNRIKGFITIEASNIIENDDAADFKGVLSKLAVNLECNPSPKGYLLNYRKGKLGCASISLGMPAGTSELANVAASVSLALDPVFQYLNIASSNEGQDLSALFLNEIARINGLNRATAIVNTNPNAAEEAAAGGGGGGPAPVPEEPPKQGFFSRMFGSKKADPTPTTPSEKKLTVDDFDLLNIVGKGAFGKVMLVRKKHGIGEGQIFAMKVLKKSVIAEKGQIEHTKSERDILFEIRHPFIVCLRFSFQSDDKLYLITDYYNGGTLFYHLRKSRSFSEERAKFYGAQLLTALDHLHQQHIIYRDLKLENILMDFRGNLALTDFGLSKQDMDKSGGATTFCGTAEYIAPELLKGQKYGKAVDWWSFGILLFEMMHGRTPFYDKNRKLMFYRIINTEPSFPPSFSSGACECIRALLRVNESERLGSSESGAEEIKATRFFSDIDFPALLRKEIEPPFHPEVTGELDTKYVPKAYLDAEARDSADDAPKGKKGKDPHHNFEAFTFAGDNTMG